MLASAVTVGLGVSFGLGGELVFGGSVVVGSTGVTDAGASVGVGVVVGDGVGAIGGGDDAVDVFGTQPNSTRGIKTNKTKKFHFIPASQTWSGICVALATMQP